MNTNSQQHPVVTTLNQIVAIVVFCMTLAIMGGAIAAWLILS